MAQVVGFFQDNIEFKEGPFVLCNANGYRVEVECKGHCTSILPHGSIYSALKQNRLEYLKHPDLELMSKSVDWLNNKVKEEKIIHVENRGWIYPEYEVKHG